MKKEINEALDLINGCNIFIGFILISIWVFGLISISIT